MFHFKIIKSRVFILFIIVFFTNTPVSFADSICSHDDVHVYQVEAPDALDLNSLNLNNVDIFVPGTNSEKGCIKQFNSLIIDGSSRTYIALHYFDPNLKFWGFTEQDQKKHGNAVKYDDSVKKGSNGLKELLQKIKDKNPNKVRVFGHSKGAHIVSHVATQFNQDSNRNWLKFWAFAQPGRTDRLDNYKGILGDPGYIHKVSENLVAITWSNDEVIHFKKDGKPPNAWKYPGEVNTPNKTGTRDLNRIDHHDNYGGEYTEDKCPYFVTGNDSLYNAKYTHLGRSKNKLGCDIVKDRKYKAYFWGDETCKSKALEANTDDWSVGEKHEIGTSGPRGDNCEEHATIPVQFKMEYFIKANNNNIAGFHVRFLDYLSNGDNKHEADTIEKMGTYRREADRHDSFWKKSYEKKQKRWIETPWTTVNVPLSFRVQIDPLHSTVNGKRNNTIHVSWLKARFTLPGETTERNVFLIGPQREGDGFTHFEGEAELGQLAGSRHANWNYMPGARGNWKIYKSSKTDLGLRAHPFKKIKVEPRNTIKITGDGQDSSRGFYKRVSLVD